MLQRDGVSRCVSPGLQSRSPAALATPAASRCGRCLLVPSGRMTCWWWTGKRNRCGEMEDHRSSPPSQKETIW